MKVDGNWRKSIEVDENWGKSMEIDGRRWNLREVDGNLLNWWNRRRLRYYTSMEVGGIRRELRAADGSRWSSTMTEIERSRWKSMWLDGSWAESIEVQGSLMGDGRYWWKSNENLSISVDVGENRGNRWSRGKSVKVDGNRWKFEGSRWKSIEVEGGRWNSAEAGGSPRLFSFSFWPHLPSMILEKREKKCLVIELDVLRYHDNVTAFHRQ